ncbi:MAG: prolyl-tRNA synthetase associated domain-containing protein [bacterium]
MINEKIVFDFLNTNNIKYTLYKHQAVFTSDEKPILIDSDLDEIPGMQSKNLFLKDTKNTFYLVSIDEHKRVDLKALSTELECGRFSFGKAENMLELIKLEPGSVTPFGLMFDQEKKVTFVLDQDFMTSTYVNFHPLKNNMTIGLRPEDFLTCMQKIGHEPIIIKIPVRN